MDNVKEKKAKVLLAAPTGKAAKRLSCCGVEGMTIHRLLEFSPADGGFARKEDYPLECDVLIVDEMSMVDSSLFYFLLLAVPAGAHLVLIGDADQLPSVGPGLVMRAMAESGTLPLTVLNRIFRQDEGSGIVRIAHGINHGLMPDMSLFKNDCHFVQQENPAKAADKVVEIVMYLRKKNVEAQVISPMKKGDVGTDRLNELLQQALNPIPAGESVESYQVSSGFRKFRVNDRVMQIRNDYDKLVFNGDQGVISSIDQEERQLQVQYDDRGLVLYDFLDLDQLMLCYAATVHKLQGCEAETAVIVCINQHFIMLARNLLYTALTRAKKKAIIVGTAKAMAIAIHNDKQKTRYTRLKERLQGFAENFDRLSA